MLRFTGMKRVFPAFMVVTGMIILLLSCSKGGSSSDNGGSGMHNNNTPPVDTTAPVLEVITPTANQVFTSGNTINVTGKITDDLGLYRGYIRITNDANGQVMKEQSYEIHYQLLYNFNLSYTPNVSVPSDYTVTVFFEDHSYLNASKSVKIKVNP